MNKPPTVSRAFCTVVAHCVSITTQVNVIRGLGGEEAHHASRECMENCDEPCPIQKNVKRRAFDLDWPLDADVDCSDKPSRDS